MDMMHEITIDFDFNDVSLSGLSYHFPIRVFVYNEL